MSNINETKREKFIRIGNARTNKALEMISLIGNLSNKSNYDYTQEDVDKIFKALEYEIKLAKSRFNRCSNNINKKFDLGE